MTSAKIGGCRLPPPQSAKVRNMLSSPSTTIAIKLFLVVKLKRYEARYRQKNIVNTKKTSFSSKVWLKVSFSRRNQQTFSLFRKTQIFHTISYSRVKAFFGIISDFIDYSSDLIANCFLKMMSSDTLSSNKPNKCSVFGNKHTE